MGGEGAQKQIGKTFPHVRLVLNPFGFLTSEAK